MVVEDEVIVSEDVKVTLLDFGYDVCCVVGTGEDTIRKIEEKVGEDTPDLILMDIVLSGEMDGITAAEEIRLRFDIPVIFLTAHATQEYINRAKKAEPYGYLSKPVVYKELESNIEMALYRHSLEKKLKDKNTQLEKIMYSIVDTIAQMIKAKNPFLGEHHSRVSQLSKVIAEEMGLSQNQIEGISLAANIHNIGLINVPYEILSKPTPLNETESNIYNSHAKTGYDLLKDIDFFWPVAKIVLQCHENMDGSGYPSNLKGEDILLEARIIKVASTMDNFIYGRPNRPPIKVDEALEKIKQNSGIRYDSDVVDACWKVIKEKGFMLD